MPILIDGIVGARPNMMKMAPLARALAADATFKLRLVHTGQHYDDAMSKNFHRDLGIPIPDVNLEVGSGLQGEQTAKILARYEKLLVSSDPRPAGVVVVGDVNSTLACSLAAVKLGIPVAHVEAGLRSGDRSMPEEINRILTDAISDLMFVSDPEGLLHLEREGRPKKGIFHVGNVMVDTLLRELPRSGESDVLQRLGVSRGEYVYLTLHRPSNVDNPKILEALIGVMEAVASVTPVVFAAHPRTVARMEAIGRKAAKGIILTKPQDYHDNVRLIKDAKAVFTDSGGIQEETSVLGVPCLTLRANTERPVTVELGTSELVGNDTAKILAGWERIRTGKWKAAGKIPLWDGHAAERIVSQLRESWGKPQV